MFLFVDQNFLKGYEKRFGILTPKLAKALIQALGFIESDTRFSVNPTDRYKIAYVLATFKWETAHTFEPIDEYGGNTYFEKRYGYKTKVGKRLGNINEGEGAKFHGRGYVQLTGRANYQKASQAFDVDLITNPDLAKQPQLAYNIAIEGMIKGAFTGKKLSQFFKPNQAPDYDRARSIINGQDQHQKIADIARRFDELLVVSLQV